MKFSEWYRNKDPLLGAIVVAFMTEGCMAQDHQFQWVGVITKRRQTVLYGSPRKYTELTVKVMKRSDHRDCRGHDLGHEYPIMEDGSFQKITPRLFFYYR